jgi:hypothetical protein
VTRVGAGAGMTAVPARVVRVVRTIRAAASAYDARVIPTGRRALRVVRRDGFHLDEAATLGILDPGTPVEDLELVASRRRLRPLQYRLNPDDSTSLTEDKAVFHRACELLGLPVPRLLGLFYGDATGWGEGGVVLTSRDEWVDFIGRVLPADFVLKPTHGHLGLLVRRLRRENGGFVDEAGGASSPESLYGWMRAQRQFRSFLFQERLHSHSALVELSGTNALQTVRAITLVDRAGTPRIVFAGQKVVTGDSPADNLHDGKTGNAVAEIDAATGRLARVTGPAPGAWRLVDLEAHPRTRVPFAGYQLPFWPETRDLLERAALAFLPLRTIGWDVALTPSGPVLIEGNAWWGPAPPNFLGLMAPILRVLEAELEEWEGSARAACPATAASSRWRDDGVSCRMSSPGPLGRVTGGVARVARVARTIGAAASAYDAPLVPTAARALRVVRRDGFRLDEAATLGILDPRTPVEDLTLFVSRGRLRPLQYRLNPHGYTTLTEDKAVFHRACELLGLPAPRLLGLFYGDASGWGAGGAVLAGRREWAHFLERGLPAEFVVKPTRGHYGLLVRQLRRQDGGFVDESGRASTPDGLYEWMRTQRQFRSFLFQERLHSHPALVELSGTETLQTTRVVTLVDRAGAPRILLACQKIVTGDSPFDNFHDGKTGNVVAEIDPATGRLGRVVGPAPGAWRLVDLHAHPRTEIPFPGHELPLWPETRELLGRAALAFLPLRAIGWDVALTSNGPVLIEGNAWWGPPNLLRIMAPVLRALEAELEARPARPKAPAPAHAPQAAAHGRAT